MEYLKEMAGKGLIVRVRFCGNCGLFERKARGYDIPGYGRCKYDGVWRHENAQCPHFDYYGNKLEDIEEEMKRKAEMLARQPEPKIYLWQYILEYSMRNFWAK